jgi:hypothetical protein
MSFNGLGVLKVGFGNGPLFPFPDSLRICDAPNQHKPALPSVNSFWSETVR